MNVTVPVVENVLKVNDEIALLNRRMFSDAHVYVIDLIGAPGSGKTALLELTLEQLTGIARTGVVVGDPATARDGQRLARFTRHVVQINTGHGCHLDANQVRQAITKLPLSDLDILVIENVGNLICPVGFDLGQHAKVGLFSVSEGDDKAAKHPHLVLTADALILNKIDLLPYVPFDVPRFREDVRHLNQVAPLMEVSVARRQIDPWTHWLLAQADKAKTNVSS
ncbi:MAG: hydrogenase nickel incorporation protein HypB [Phycisphaerae bacterium]|nr:hydrogenase nickel incorporation protein HypB [Phycisphaerae bacterium]